MFGGGGVKGGVAGGCVCLHIVYVRVRICDTMGCAGVGRGREGGVFT